MAKRPTTEPSKVRPRTGDALVPRRYTKGIGRDRTDPHQHGSHARGGPIERRYIEPEKRGLTSDDSEA